MLREDDDEDGDDDDECVSELMKQVFVVSVELDYRILFLFRLILSIYNIHFDALYNAVTVVAVAAVAATTITATVSLLERTKLN